MRKKCGHAPPIASPIPWKICRPGIRLYSKASRAYEANKLPQFSAFFAVHVPFDTESRP